MQDLECTILQNTPIAQGIYSMEVEWLGDMPLPGQFFHLMLEGGLTLRRPISVDDFDEASRALTLVYQVVGEGTQQMAQLRPGGRLRILGPVGNGFPSPAGAKRGFLVGGGIGCAPLLYAAKAWPEMEWTAFLGFRSDAFVYQQKEFSAACSRVVIATEDGTVGEKGFITAPLKAALEIETPDVLFACGPKPLFSALESLITGDLRRQSYFSLEERMGCGVGACLVCNCKTRTKQEPGWQYRRVCVDGPVFPMEEVVL